MFYTIALRVFLVLSIIGAAKWANAQTYAASRELDMFVNNVTKQDRYEIKAQCKKDAKKHVKRLKEDNNVSELSREQKLLIANEYSDCVNGGKS